MVELTNTSIAAALTPALVANSLSPVVEPLLRATQSCGRIEEEGRGRGVGGDYGWRGDGWVGEDGAGVGRIDRTSNHHQNRLQSTANPTHYTNPP